ncbi:MAG: hypothetical protein ACFFCK_10175, partial [Promethearchaeota archaeon]
LVVLVLPAEIYLFDWVYSEVKGARNKGPIHSKALDHNDISVESEAEKKRIMAQAAYPRFVA